MSEMANFPRIPIKYIADVLSGGTPRSNSQNWDGDVPFITPPDLNGLDGELVKRWGRTVTEVGAKTGSTLTQNAVLISCRAPVGHIGTVKDEVSFNQGCKAVVPADEADLSFISKCLVADRKALQVASRGTTFTELSTTELSNHAIPWPEPSIRHHIADYLDHETGEIAAMIEKLDSLASQLKDRKSALSSSFFVGDFEQVKLKWLLDEVDDRASERSINLPLLSVSIHHGVQLRDGSLTNQNPSEKLDHYKVAKPGQIVLNRMRAFQGGLGASKWHGLVSPDYSVLQTRDQLTPGWAEFMMRTTEFVSSMTQALRGIGGVDQGNVRTPRINVRDLLELPIPLPPLEKQHRIADHLDEVTDKIDAMLTKVAQFKDLLTERRAALITDVVTGRKDVA